MGKNIELEISSVKSVKLQDLEILITALLKYTHTANTTCTYKYIHRYLTAVLILFC